MCGMDSWRVGRCLRQRLRYWGRYSDPNSPNASLNRAVALPARPTGLALAQERGDALAGVLGAERGREAALLGLDALVQIALGRDALDLLDRHRRLAAELARPGQGRVEELVVGDALVGEAELVGLRRRDGIAQQVHLERLALAHQAREPLRSAEAGDDPEVDLGLSEARRLGRDPEVARHRQLAASAERQRVHRRDRDLARLLHPAQHPVAAVQELLARSGVGHLGELL